MLFLLHSSQCSVCQSKWMFPVDSGVVDAGVQFVQVSKAAAQNSRGRVSMARETSDILCKRLAMVHLD